MGLLRTLSYSAIVGAILVGSPYFGPDGRLPSFGLGQAEAAPALQESPTVEPTSTLPSAPTPTASAVAPTETATSTATAGADTQTPTPTAALTETPNPSGSPTLGTITPTPTPSGTPSPTLTPVADLPPLAVTPDRTGTITEATIGEAGGRISTPDGRAIIDFPQSAVTEPLSIKITKRETHEQSPPTPNTRFAGLWNFDARSVASGNRVTQFGADLIVSIRFGGDETLGLDPQTLTFWTFDDLAQSWRVVPATVTPADRHLTLAVDHFTGYGATATPIVSMAPLLLGSNVNLQTGSAALSVPIDVLPGRVGLAPQLNLSYDSMRVQEMRNYSSQGSWVGQGWELGVGSIQISYDPSGSRYFLEMAGFGGEMMREGMEGTNHILRTRDEQFARIRTQCSDGSCPWYVTDKRGTQYVFGTDEAHRRWYGEYDTAWFRRYYKLDLAYIQDVFGNRIDYTYARFLSSDCIAFGNCYQYVLAAYPQDIYYNYNASQAYAQVHFNLGSDPNGARNDTPTYGFDQYCENQFLEPNYFPPKVREIRRLDSVEIKSYDQDLWKLVRRYDFSYTTTNFQIQGSTPYGGGYCPPIGIAGDHKLDTISVKGTDGASQLYQSSYTYADQSSAHMQGAVAEFTYSLPHMMQANNGFGGSVNFAYTFQDAGGSLPHWARSAVTQETKTGGAGQPPIVTTYSYVGPYQQSFSNPYNPGVPDSFNAENLGYSTVTETDSSSGNKVIHRYHVSELPYGLAHGREYETVIQDSASAQWHKTKTTWDFRGVANLQAGTSHYWVNFVFPSAVDTWLKDNTHLRVENYYDSYGNLQMVDDLGDVDVPGARVATYMEYRINTTNWLFPLQYTQQWDGGSAFLGCTRYYYDGAGGPNANNAPVTKGLLTATSTVIVGTIEQCHGGPTAFTQSSNIYRVYNTNGNLYRESVPTLAAPETQAAGQDSYGWTPASTAVRATYYNWPDYVLPSGVTNFMGHITAITYDLVTRKPLVVQDPDSEYTLIYYDVHGRVDRVVGQLDSYTYPTTKYTYNWGSAPNRTLTEQRIAHGASAVRKSVLCMDGFGREVDRREQYRNNQMNSTRTDYNARGLVAAKTNPAYHFTLTDCNALATVTDRDRTAFQYDTLGNVIRTDFLPVGAGSPAYTQASYSGKTTTFTNERLYQTTHLRNIGARTLTVTEPGGGVTTYQHDRLGRLTGVTDAASNGTTIAYDLAGRKTSMVDPDMGAWTYGYDAAGNLTTQTDARPVTTTLTYDADNRITLKTFSNGDFSEAFTYDVYQDSTLCSGQYYATAVGKLTFHMVGFLKRYGSLCYDVLGRELASRTTGTTIGNQTYDVRRTYNALGQPTTLTYPDGEIATYSYDASGSLSGLVSAPDGQTQPLLTGAYQTPAMRPESLPLGNGRTTNYTYDFRLRTQTIKTGTLANPGSTQDLVLGYDEASNVTAITDNYRSEASTYAYDSLDRLTGMWIGSFPAATYAYNAIGNLTSKSEGGQNFTLNYPSSGPGSVRPHAVTSTTGNPILFVSYDANGNLCANITVNPCPASGPNAYLYDAQNRLKSRPVTGGTVSYLYDALGSMLKRTNADGSYTIYIGGIFEKNFTSGGAVTSVKKYYSAFGRAVAVRDVPGGTGAGTLRYLLSDHLGTTVGSTDSAGGDPRTQAYWPYGAVRDSPISLGTDKLFTGQREEAGDAALGLYDYQARYYSTTLGRFVGVDPMVARKYVPQAWNGYSYVRNSPVTRNDPTGQFDPDDPSSPGFRPAPDEDSRGRSILNDPSCSDLCAALIYCALLPAACAPPSIGELQTVLTFLEHPEIDWAFIAVCTLRKSECFGQVVDDGRNSGELPVGVDVGIDFIPYIGDGRALSDPSLSPGYGFALLLFASPAPGDRAATRHIDDLTAEAKKLYPKKAGKTELHHVVPKYLGGDPKGTRVALNAAYHQLITNEFRRQYKYGQDVPPVEQRLEILQQVYEKYPLP